MRKILLSLMIAFVAVSCTTNEEKASRIITNELQKTLYDFDSYQPIETNITQITQNAKNDSTCLVLATQATQVADKIVKICEKIEEAHDGMNLWGKPTRYSSSYSDSKYNHYYSEFKFNCKICINEIDLFNKVYDSLSQEIKKLDTTNIVGWNIEHKFRCKSRGGVWDIVTYRYIVDNDFSTIKYKSEIDTDYAGMIMNIYKAEAGQSSSFICHLTEENIENENLADWIYMEFLYVKMDAIFHS